MSAFRFVSLLAAAPAIMLAAAPAHARAVQPFTVAAFQAAQKAGSPILVDAFAPWCPTCRAQKPTIDALATDPRFAKLVILKLDYDNQKAAKAALGIRMQSTLIAFSGKSETGRSTGITDPAAIRALAARALR